MAKEIERKFLVKDLAFKNKATSSVRICQAYLSTDPSRTVRVRIKGEQAFITIKGISHGATRDEWEYEIPTRDALDIIALCPTENVIDKTRYIVDVWEIDEFHGNLQGLIVAEIELQSENESFICPPFIGREVTGDIRYYNSYLASSKTVPPTD